MLQTEKLMVQEVETTTYNRAKMWQIALFSCNNAATNVTLFLVGFYAFFTQNVLGLAAVVVGAIAMAVRIFDAVIDPIFGFILDRTNGKFGKFRPYMLLGNVIMFITVVILFNVPSSMSVNSKYFVTVLLYVIYMIGYTFQTTVTKGAQVCLTNDPKQRPVIVMFDSINTALVFSGEGISLVV